MFWYIQKQASCHASPDMSMCVFCFMPCRIVLSIHYIWKKMQSLQQEGPLPVINGVKYHCKWPLLIGFSSPNVKHVNWAHLGKHKTPLKSNVNAFMARPKTYQYLGPEKNTHTKITKTISSISFKPAQQKQPKEKGCLIRDCQTRFFRV